MKGGGKWEDLTGIIRGKYRQVIKQNDLDLLIGPRTDFL